MKNKHRGSSFDDFLKEEGLFEDCSAEAVKRVIVFQECKMETSYIAMDHPFDSEEPCSNCLALVGADEEL